MLTTLDELKDYLARHGLTAAVKSVEFECDINDMSLTIEAVVIKNDPSDSNTNPKDPVEDLIKLFNTSMEAVDG